MSSITPFTCLFCQHTNPAGAIFCNSCAAQLNLKPCLNCDAVDDRMAINCYKCGTPFPLLQMPKPDATVIPPVPETAQTTTALGHGVLVDEKKVPFRRDVTPALTVIEQSHKITGPDRATAAVHRSDWLMSGTAFLLVLLGVSAYMYLRPPEKNILTPDTKALVQTAPAAPVTPAASGVAPQVDAKVTPADTPRPTTVGTNVTGKVSTAVPPSAGSPPRIESSPVTDSEAATHRVPPMENECVPAVAALGLCNP